MRDRVISIIIPTHAHDGRIAGLENLIRSLVSASNAAFIGEIVIVDNGNSLASGAIMSIEKRIRIVGEARIGLNYARNTGVSSAQHDIVAFLDDDVTVSTHWAESIARGHEDNDVLCVGGPVLVKNGGLKACPRWFSNYFLRFLLPADFPKQAGIVRAPYYLIGANMSFKKKTFTEFGVFDAVLDRKGSNLLSNGDTEFIMRIPETKVRYEPRAKVFEEIFDARLTRRFMVRRLFWQGISDYVMVKKRGLATFYDKEEVFLSLFFFKEIVLAAAAGNPFESFCRIVRYAGFACGKTYEKIGRRLPPTSR